MPPEGGSIIQKLLQIVPNITTPISLAAFALVILYLVFQLLFKSKLLAKIEAPDTAALLNKIVHGVFFLVLVTLVLAMLPSVRTAFGPSSPTHDEVAINTMIANWTAGPSSWDDALNDADNVLEKDPRNDKAFAVKGSIAFYRGDFKTAFDYFKSAYNADPTNDTNKRNLADAEVEIGDIPDAITRYKAINNGGQQIDYDIGRAYLLQGDYSSAQSYLAGLPANYDRGKAQVLLSASLCGLALKESSADTKKALVSQARTQFISGISEDKSFWADVLQGRNQDFHEPFSPKLISLLAPVSHLIATVPATWRR